MARWLRRKSDGVIYGWHEILAKFPELEEISEEEAWPERYAAMPPEQKAVQLAKATLNENFAKGLDVPTEIVNDLPLRKDATRKIKT